MSNNKIVVSRRVVLENGIVSAGLVINNGEISAILTGEDLKNLKKNEKILDFGDAVIMPGVVDSHVHVNEPGRTEWEGFWTATQAAAAGGVTTIVDMPLNSIPPTTTTTNLNKKLKAAEGQLHVDVAFWGGLIPSNQESLIPLVKAGVVGFKCFLCPSGVDEFPKVTEDDLRKAMKTLEGTEVVLAFHAEIESNGGSETSDPEDYNTFLASRPGQMELDAVDLICRLSLEYNVRCHIVHASANEVINKVREAREKGSRITAETCHHYLSLSAENVPVGGTHFKCCPPIRSKENQDALWRHVQKGDVSLIVSDHSPCPPGLKQGGNFMTAWGGISSLQFGLSLLWTSGAPRGMSLLTLSRLLSSGPAKLCRLAKKGSIGVGKDADLVVFDPDCEFLLEPGEVFHRHKISPYFGRKFKGRVLLTMLRGEIIFRRGESFKKPGGKIILLKNS